MRSLAVLFVALGGCSSENVAPLKDFGPISAYIDVELGPLAADSSRDECCALLASCRR